MITSPAFTDARVSPAIVFPMGHSYAPLVMDPSFSVETHAEEDLTWQQHNEIHRALNLAYSARTKSFHSRTYGVRAPLKRILCRYEGVLVGHTAVFEDYAEADGRKVRIGCMGMTFSLRPRQFLGSFLRKSASELCGNMGYPFAVGRIWSTPEGKEKYRPLVVDYLDIPLVASNGKSHSWETLAIYDTGTPKNLILPILESFKNAGCVKITGGLF
jgi:hypothetical protein